MGYTHRGVNSDLALVKALAMGIFLFKHIDLIILAHQEIFNYLFHYI